MAWLVVNARTDYSAASELLLHGIYEYVLQRKFDKRCPRIVNVLREQGALDQQTVSGTMLSMHTYTCICSWKRPV
jgi:hypothetical protein